MTKEKPISKSKVVLVEGKDEDLFFSAMIRKLDLTPEVDVRPIHGKDNLSAALKALKNDPGYYRLTSVGITRDADNNADSAFRKVCSALQRAEMPVPSDPLVSTGGRPKVTVMILPVGKPSGMLEDVFLESVAEVRR